ncbi:hypothetical protein GALMADRAFT_273212 [Galerina marginata CBS 339.88]|uniref:Uncharacterized protein n=1 Tax=Galerina marginata (strain CBS 339.88) TaxID=685588 RepID=A0A067S974_GALM3|nr:hypothetical protein GALMADRAFT_273212 [Galerina marginata CBS 339.88]
MASNGDDTSPISSPPGPKHETPEGSERSPTPPVDPPQSQTLGLVPPHSTNSPSRPPPTLQQSIVSTDETEQSSWNPPLPHAQLGRHNPDPGYQRLWTPSTPFISPGDLPDEVNENRDAGASWGPVNHQVSPAEEEMAFNGPMSSTRISKKKKKQQSSLGPAVPYPQPRSDDFDDRRVWTPSTAYIQPLGTPPGDTEDRNAGAGWGSASYQVNPPRKATRFDRAPPSAHSPYNEQNWQESLDSANPYRTQRRRRSPDLDHQPARNPNVPFMQPGPGGPVTPNVGLALRYDSTLPSAHSISNPSWVVDVYSQRLQITNERLRLYQDARLQLIFESQLNDLFAGSLVPLTQQYRPHDIEKIMEQATVFFSSFHSNAHWYTDVGNLPHRIGKVIDGLTANSRNSDLGFRFMRFRFPYIKFEWFLETPYSEILAKMRLGTGSNEYQPTEVEVLWKAWARAGAASGLVAYGSIKDTIQIAVTGPNEWDRVPVMLIADRHFIITQVFQPELMTPVPYHRELPPLSRREDIMIFSTSWTVIQFLRSSQIRIGFLIALSALFAALQPIVGKYTAVGAWILAIIGVLSGLISVVAVSFGWLLTRIEAQAAKARQSTVDK